MRVRLFIRLTPLTPHHALLNLTSSRNGSWAGPREGDSTLNLARFILISASGSCARCQEYSAGALWERASHDCRPWATTVLFWYHCGHLDMSFRICYWWNTTTWLAVWDSFISYSRYIMAAHQVKNKNIEYAHTSRSSTPGRSDS